MGPTSTDLMFELGNKAIFRRYDADPTPSAEGGVIYVATHINGLIDPMVITRVQNKRVISLGRHDLTTRPVIGWWARRFGTQPVLRRAEVEAGVVDADFARHINYRGMLTVASCLATGHSAVVMPEGKSHQDCKLHALRTGSLCRHSLLLLCRRERFTRTSNPNCWPTLAHSSLARPKLC